MRGNGMKHDCQMVEEIATFSDSGVILTRLDVSTIVENYSSIFCFYYDREGQRRNCYLRIIRCGLPELIA